MPQMQFADWTEQMKINALHCVTATLPHLQHVHSRPPSDILRSRPEKGPSAEHRYPVPVGVHLALNSSELGGLDAKDAQ
jgi:hypothetical protein